MDMVIMMMIMMMMTKYQRAVTALMFTRDMPCFQYIRYTMQIYNVDIQCKYTMKIYNVIHNILHDKDADDEDKMPKRNDRFDIST